MPFPNGTGGADNPPVNGETVFILEEFELAAVSGGDHWCREGGDDEDMANSYQNSSGSWGAPSASVSAMQTLALMTARSGESLSLCYTVQAGPATSQTCFNQDGTKTMQSCVNAGPSASIGGFGFGVQGNACTSRTVGRWYEP